MIDFIEARRRAFDAMSTNDIDGLRSALELLTAIDTPEALAMCVLATATLSAMHGDMPAAIEGFSRARDLFRDLNDEVNLISTTINVGMAHLHMGAMADAFALFREALAFAESRGDHATIARLDNNIGTVYRLTGDYPKAAEYYLRALEYYEQHELWYSIGMVCGNLGGVYRPMQDPQRAMQSYQRALEMFERTDNVFGMTQTLGAIGQTLENLNDNTGCEQHFLRAIELARSIDHDIEASRWSIYLASLYLSTDRVEEARLLIASLANKEFVDPQLICMYDQISGDLHLNDGDLDAAWTVFDHARAFAASINSPHMAVDAHGSLRDVARRRGDLETYIEHSEEYHRLTEELHGRDAAVRLTVLEKQREIDDLERRNQRHLEILYSTLPREIADRVARGEEVSGDRYDQTVVFFIDIVGFTAHSADLPDAALVRMLSKIYGAFDAICARHSITKIKTIGDSYMAFSADKPLVNVIKCACEMMAVQFEWPSSDDATVPVRFRMGMHIGPVTAGVIGTERLQYDIWGDTVNVASRMESTGEPGRIHVSEAFAAALRSVDSGRWTVDNTNDSMTHDSVTLQQRGEITVKGKGPMTTYWLMQS